MKTKYKVGDIVEITQATGFRESANGDRATVQTIYDFKDGCFAVLHKNNELIHLCEMQATIIRRPLINREYLQDFVYKNKIKTTLVSKYLGYSKGWLSQTMNRQDRGDLTEDELQEIMDKLHIDWESTNYVHVKETKQHTAYKTKPCNYTTELHKARLQQSFWNGEFTHG